MCGSFVSKILVVRSCAIGDFVLNMPALRALQLCHPHASFTLVGNPETLSVAYDFLTVAQVHSIEQEPWCRLFYQPIEGLEFDMGIVWMRDPTVADNLRRSSPKSILGLQPYPERGHAASHLVGTIGLNMPELPDLWTPSSEAIILQPGSGGKHKCWRYFRELADVLPSATFLIGPAEADFDTGDHPRIEGLRMRQVSALLRNVRGFIGNDSGITHLAAYLGCPTIAIFGPTDPETWGPLGRRVQISRNPSLEHVRACAAEF